MLSPPTLLRSGVGGGGGVKLARPGLGAIIVFTIGERSGVRDRERSEPGDLDRERDRSDLLTLLFSSLSVSISSFLIVGILTLSSSSSSMISFER